MEFFQGLLWGTLYYLVAIVSSAVFNPVNGLYHPPSGIALAGLVLTGWPALPGIIIGIFLEFLGHGLLTGASTAESFNLSIQSVFTLIPQFALSYCLLAKILGKNFDILTNRAIPWFLFIAITTSVISPILGLFAYPDKAFPGDSQILHLLALQAIGHSLGYILVTPIFLVIFQNYNSRNWPDLVKSVAPLVALFLITGIGLYGYISMEAASAMPLDERDASGNPASYMEPLGSFQKTSISDYALAAITFTSLIVTGWALGFNTRRQQTEKVVSLRTRQLQSEIRARRKIENQLHHSMDMLESVNQGLSSFVIECDKHKSLDEQLLKIRDVSHASGAILALILSRDDGTSCLAARGTPGFPFTKNWSEPFIHQGNQWREHRGTNSPITRCLKNQCTQINNQPGKAGWNNGSSPIRSIAVIPISYENKMLGMISLLDRPEGFTHSLITYLEPLLTTIGVAVKSMLDQAEKDELNRKIIKQATTDTLTKLPNRNALQKEIKNLLSNRNPSGYIYTHIDLDHFDLINDHHGHQAGDYALRQIAGFLLCKLVKGELIFHFNGDKFALILKARGTDGINQRLQELLDHIRTFRFSWISHILSLNASVGAVVMSENDRSCSTLFQHADFACEMAKSLGRNRYHIYNTLEHHPNSAKDEMAELARINSALDQERFVIFAQPILQTGQYDPGPQMEVLARMIGHDGRMVMPTTFLPIMERFGLSTLLDMQIIKKCLACLRECQDSGHPLPRVNLNLSGQSLADPGFLEFLLKTIPSYGEYWTALCFEITETQAISNLISAKKMIATLKSKGCKFALDDFGRGLSSFSYLKDFDVDYLKIDGTFVIDICEDERDRAMIVSIHELAHALGMKTIAEFAENEAIVNTLEKTGIDFIQGFAIGEAIPFKDCYKQISQSSTT